MVLQVRRLQRAVPSRGVDANGANFDAMIARIAHDLGGRIEAHGLRVQQSRAEDVRMVALEPRGGVGDQRERGGVALGESIAAETLQLAEGLLREVPLIALGDHAVDKLVAELRDASRMLEGRHGTAKLVGFAGSKTGAHDSDAHGLLLEERHARASCQAPSPIRASGNGPAQCRRAGADRDAPYRPGSALAGRSQPR